MKTIIFTAMLCVASWSASAQSINSDVIVSGRGWTFSHSPSDRYKFVVFEVVVPANSVGLIGLLRQQGSGDHDIRIGTAIRPGSYERAEVSGIVASDDSDDSAPDLLFIPPSSSRRTYYIEVYSHDNAAGKWRIRYEHFAIFEAALEALAWATGQYLIESAVQCALFGCDSEPNNENLGRAVTLAMSVMNRTSVCSIGTDMVVNEMQTAISREMPDARFFMIWVSNFGATLAAKAARVTCPA